MDRSCSIWLDPALVFCLRLGQCCMLWPNSICCRSRASVIIGPVTFYLVAVTLSASLLTYRLCHRLCLNSCHACSAVRCGLSRSLVANVSVSIIMIRDVSETVLFLQKSQLILSLLLISWIYHACKLINVVNARHSIYGSLKSIWRKRFLHFPLFISFSETFLLPPGTVSTILNNLGFCKDREFNRVEYFSRRFYPCFIFLGFTYRVLLCCNGRTCRNCTILKAHLQLSLHFLLFLFFGFLFMSDSHTEIQNIANEAIMWNRVFFQRICLGYIFRLWCFFM